MSFKIAFSTTGINTSLVLAISSVGKGLVRACRAKFTSDSLTSFSSSQGWYYLAFFFTLCHLAFTYSLLQLLFGILGHRLLIITYSHNLLLSQEFHSLLTHTPGGGVKEVVTIAHDGIPQISQTLQIPPLDQLEPLCSGASAVQLQARNNYLPSLMLTIGVQVSFSTQKAKLYECALWGAGEKIRKGDITIAHTSASVKWLHDCLKSREHYRISQLLARLPEHNEGFPPLIIYSEFAQVKYRGNYCITLLLRPASPSRICFLVHHLHIAGCS